ncbi:unnamed protein product, partial [Ectocarpus sp. 12 AP-2014]
MSMVYTILEEDLVDLDFVREQTDLILLVRDDNGKLLRESDLEDEGSDEVFYYWDETAERLSKAPGSMGSTDKTLDLGDARPALEGNFKVDEVSLTPAFEHMRREAMRFSPESTAEETGIHPDIVREEARLFAAAKKAAVLSGFASAKMLNGIYTQWAQILMCALTGHGGDRGGYWSPWTDWGWESTYILGFLQTGKMPRFESGGLGEYVHGKKIIEARQHYDNDRLRERAGFDVNEMQSMIEEAIETGQMPIYEGIKGGILMADNKFARNKGRHYRDRILEEFSELYVNINIRMDSTAEYADYVLPGSGHYEGWDIRMTPLHRFGNLFTAPVKPLGEGKQEWDIFVLLTQKIQERALARGVGSYPDGP